MSDIFGIGTIVSSGLNLFGRERGFDVSRDMQEDEQEFNAEQAQLNRDWQTAERVAQNDWNLSMWERNNEYNSLDSQIKRALAAGVNPNAIIGGSLGQVASAPQGSNIGSGAQAQTPSIAAQALDAYASMPDGIIGGINGLIDAAQKNVDYEYSDDIYKKRLQEFDAHIAELGSKKGLNEAEIKKIEEETRWIPKLNDAQIEQINALISKYSAEVSNLKAHENLLKAQVKTEEAKKGLISEQIVTEEAKQGLISEQIVTEGYKQADLGASAELKSEQSDYYTYQADIAHENLIKEQFLNDFRSVTGLDPGMSIIPAIGSIIKSGKFSVWELLDAASLLFGFGALPKVGGLAVKGLAKAGRKMPKFLKKLFTNKSAKSGVDNFDELGFGGAH